MTSSRSVNTWLLVFRLFAGAFWLAHGLPKFLNSAMFMPPNGFMPQMIGRSSQSGGGAYHDFLVNVVTPHIGLFAELVRLGEVLTGISLLLGFLTPVGGIAGCLLALNYLAANGELHSVTGLGTLDGAAFAISFFCIVLPLGRIAGIDALLARPRRPSRVVRAEFVDEPMTGPRAPAD